MNESNIESLSELEEASAELEEIYQRIRKADKAYHGRDDPEIADAEYDRLKSRAKEILKRFPELKSADSPNLNIGWPAREGFAKVAHAVKMLSLENAFKQEDVENSMPESGDSWVLETIERSNTWLSRKSTGCPWLCATKTENWYRPRLAAMDRSART